MRAENSENKEEQRGDIGEEKRKGGVDWNEGV